MRRLRLPLDPPFHAAWDPVPRTRFDATVVRVDTDEGVVGFGSGDTMDGFDPYRELFVGKNLRRLVSVAFFDPFDRFIDVTTDVAIGVFFELPE